jgi:hypothetical protein
VIPGWCQVDVMTIPQVPGPPAWLLFEQIGIPILAFAFGGFLVWQIFRTVNRYLERRHGGVDAQELEGLRTDVKQLQERIGTMEDWSLRLGEVEERIDFAERLLTKERERRERLQSGD